MNVARHGRELGQRRVRRHRLNIAGSVAPPIVTPPVISVPPTLVISADGLSLIYTAGVWSGVPMPTVTATLNIIGVGSVPATPNMPIQASWRGRNVNVSESAINAGGGPVITGTPNLAIPTVSLDDQVQAILAGREGCVFDFSDKSTLFADIAATVPVTADGQSVARVDSKWGTLSMNFNTSVVARWPVAAANGVVWDGVDDVLSLAPPRSFMNNAPVITAGVSFIPTDLARPNGTPIYFSRPGSSTQNWFDIMVAGASLRFLTRRIETDATTSITSPASTLTEDVLAVGLGEADFAGTGRLEARLNGVDITGANINGALGNTQAADSAGGNIGSATPSTSRFVGTTCKIFLSRFKLTLAERDVVEAWLAA